MPSYAHPAPIEQNLGGGFAGAIALHVALAAAIIGAAFLPPLHKNTWGDKATSVGAIQASMVSSIPLPTKAPVVDKSVLTSENVTQAPAPQTKEMAAAPPKPTDLLIKEKPVTKVAPKDTVAPVKHPQPVPDTPKASAGDAATQLPQSTTPVKNGTATATVQDRAFGNRYAYYVAIVGRTVAQNWYTQEADPTASQGKRTTMVFDIQRDGTITNIRTQNRSGSFSLDASALHALQRIDGFGALPAGDHITVEYTFDYRQP
jgi:protein TonB